MRILRKLKIYFLEVKEIINENRKVNKTINGFRKIIKKHDPKGSLLNDFEALKLAKSNHEYFSFIIDEVKKINEEKYLDEELKKYEDSRLAIVRFRNKLKKSLTLKELKSLDETAWLFYKIREELFQKKYPQNKTLRDILLIDEIVFIKTLEPVKRINSKWDFNKSELAALAEALIILRFIKYNGQSFDHREILAKQFYSYFKIDVRGKNESTNIKMYQEFKSSKPNAHVEFFREIFSDLASGLK